MLQTVEVKIGYIEEEIRQMCEKLKGHLSDRDRAMIVADRKDAREELKRLKATFGDEQKSQGKA